MSNPNHKLLSNTNNIAVLAAATLGVIASLTATQLPAQTVTLKTFDGNSSISGEMVEVDDDYYRIQTIAGVLEVAIQTVVCTGAACPVLIPEYIVGEEVTLTLKDGSANVTGEVLLSTDAEITILSDLLGQVTFDRSEVACSGPNCHLARTEKSAASIIQALLNGAGN